MSARALVTAAALLLLASGCTRPEEAQRILSAQGLRDVEVTGYRAFRCSEDDAYATGFEATGADGSRVTGTVCAGLWAKGATVRYD